MAQNEESPRESEIGLHLLTKGELDCLMLVNVRVGKRKLYSKEIGPRLGISAHTVDARVKRACQKLGTNSRFVAARMVAEASLAQSDVTVTSPNANLVYENVHLPNPESDDKRRASAGEGDSLDDLGRRRIQRLVSLWDSDDGRTWFKLTQTIATIFWAANKFSSTKRIYAHVLVAIGFILAVGILINGVSGLSRLLEVPKEAASHSEQPRE